MAHVPLPLGADGNSNVLAVVPPTATVPPSVENPYIDSERHAPNDEPDHEDEDSNTLSQESAARADFINTWRSTVESRRNETAIVPANRRARAESEDSQSSTLVDSDDSPSRYSRRSKQARNVCCDCSRSSCCGITVNCPCRNAGQACTDCDSGLCGSCVNRPELLAPRPRPGLINNSRLADRRRQLQQQQQQAQSDDSSPLFGGATSTTDPSDGLGGGPSTAGDAAAASRTSTDHSDDAATSRDGAGDNDTTDPESTQRQRESTEGEGVFRFGQRGAEQQQQQQQGARANRRVTFQFDAHQKPTYD